MVYKKGIGEKVSGIKSFDFIQPGPEGIFLDREKRGMIKIEVNKAVINLNSEYWVAAQNGMLGEYNKRILEMNIVELEMLEKLDKTDHEKVIYFLRLLLNKSKYKKIREEILLRRGEIKCGDILEHEEIWKKLDV